MTAREMLGNLTDYDVAELLLLLADAQRTGTFEVRHPGGVLRLDLHEGRLLDVTFGFASGDQALALLLDRPEGSFTFLARDPQPDERRGRPVAAALLAALRMLPPPELQHPGPMKVGKDVDLERLALHPTEREALDLLNAGNPAAEVAARPPLAAAVARLERARVIVPRKIRVARLTLGVWRGGTGSAVVDTKIMAIWEQQVGSVPREVHVRTDEGRVVSVPVRGAPNLGTQMLLPPELLVRLGLRAAGSVLVRPPDPQA